MIAKGLYELPRIHYREPNSVKKLAGLLELFVDGKLPGVGIVHHDSAPEKTNARYIHGIHQSLIRQAARLTDPELRVQMGFTSIMEPSYDGRTERHIDLVPYDNIPNVPSHQIAKLHTAAPGIGAKVLLANTTPAARAGVGETYPKVVDMFDPIASEAELYRMIQLPYDSVLFRSVSSMGPVSIHDFDSLVPGATRQVAVSELTIYTGQPLHDFKPHHLRNAG